MGKVLPTSWWAIPGKLIDPRGTCYEYCISGWDLIDICVISIDSNIGVAPTPGTMEVGARMTRPHEMLSMTVPRVDRLLRDITRVRISSKGPRVILFHPHRLAQ
jgi:hypothetical protein